MCSKKSIWQTTFKSASRRRGLGDVRSGGARRRVMVCPNGCGYMGDNLEYHYRNSPFCRPVKPTEKRQRDGSTSARLFHNRVMGTMERAMLQAHIDKYIPLTHLDFVRTLVISMIHMTVQFIQDEADLPSNIRGYALEPFINMPSVGAMTKARRKCYSRATPKTLSITGGDKKGGVFFSAVQLVTVFLQECSPPVRQQIIKSSELWKSGVLYNKKPEVITDYTHGSRFYTRYDVCGKASATEEKHLRVALHMWQDEFSPLDGLSHRARLHKYGIVLLALLNICIEQRFYEDHILLLTLYNSTYAKTNGGLVRMLTGIDKDGKHHDDILPFADELQGDCCPIIELPNDQDPSGPRISYTLRLFLCVVSLDWLAQGDFGAFASSVSARRPCFKCKWTSGCPCAWMHSSDPRRATMKHTKICCGVEPRTHESVMEIVRELREVAKMPRSKTRLQEMMTETGIFSLFFASEYLLKDLVKDACVDIMHSHYAGKSRYLWSWLTDALIPSEFSWADLNKAKRAHSFPRDVRVADMARSKGDNRGSLSIHLNAYETLHWTLARYPC